MIRIAAILGMLFLSVPSMGQEQRPLVLMGTKIPGLFDTETPGPYNQIYNRLIGGYSGDYMLREAPLRRAVTAFIKGDVDCLFFASNDKEIYIDRGMAEGSLIFSNPINAVSFKLYSREGDPVIHDIESINGAYIAVDQAATDIARAANHLSITSDKLLPAQTLAQAFLLLKQGRVDAVLAFDSDVNIYLNNLPETVKYGVSENLSFGASEDSAVCRRSVTSVTFMSHINDRLSRLSASGELTEILSGQKD